MSRQNLNENYLGNPNIKKDGITSNFAQEEVLEYARCMKDPVYFIEKYANWSEMLQTENAFQDVLRNLLRGLLGLTRNSRKIQLPSHNIKRYQ